MAMKRGEAMALQQQQQQQQQQQRSAPFSPMRVLQAVMALCAVALVLHRPWSPAEGDKSGKVSNAVGFAALRADSSSEDEIIVTGAGAGAAATERDEGLDLDVDVVEDDEDASRSAGSGGVTTKTGRPDMTVIVLGYKRYASLQRLLKSLDAAEYFGDLIRLEVHIDGGSGPDWDKSIQVAKEFEWKYGPKEVRVAEKNGGLANAWLTAWMPETDQDRALILEDDLFVSTVFYKWLKLMYDTYDDRPEVAAYTLQRQHLVPGKGRSHTLISEDPFGYKLLGSWGFAPSAKHWREFLKLDFEHMNPSVPGLITTVWFNRQRRGKMWTQFWIWYCNKHNLYNICATPPNRKALGTNYRERGVHYGKSRGADYQPLTAEEWPANWDAPPRALPLYSWSLKPEGTSYPPEAHRPAIADAAPAAAGPAAPAEPLSAEQAEEIAEVLGSS
mmetsp:Transcript_1029/g.2639  ORF Transcript_1029/g.2639 Transcript_1029/m.2639 type:complete len:444 (+) Transcript_1029:74-1405(+)